ncbi:nucleotide-binding universal stress UspA family protein [Rhizobium petrolearium]|nr:nucleotide-binding universal stress UspA family protein [Neorhizobium petrolearium]
MRHVLLATDGSESAARATEVAVGMALTGGGKLSILTVEGHAREDIKQFARAEGSVGDAIEGLANQILHQAKEAAHEAGVPDVEVQSARGDSAEVIIDKAR